MKNKNFVAVGLIIGSMLISSFSFYFWQVIYTANILVDQEARIFRIPPASDFKYVQNALYDEGIVNDLVSFSFLAKIKSYDQHIKPGIYKFRSDMSNNDAINMLRAGDQTPIKLTFSTARGLPELAAKIASYMEFDSLDMISALLDPEIATTYGFTTETFMCLFIPNTYEVYATETPIDILNRIQVAYDNYWTKERLEHANKIGLSPIEVITLASIVDAETNRMDEAPRVAGVYINRLKKGIKLQADPTLVFALGDYSIKRVLLEHMKVDSPYNTYKYAGLPPGPINLPAIAAIEAVLNFETHNFLFFCADADFYGYHKFAKTLSEHNENARNLHNVLNKRKIFK